MHIFIKAVSRVLLHSAIIGVIALDVQARQQEPQSTVVQDSTRRSDTNTQRVTGIITDASSGKPLDGISISVEGFSASITDEHGKFKLSVPNYDAVLIVSGFGFQSKEVALKGRKSISTSLYDESFNSLNDKAMLPFGDKSTVRQTGAIEAVTIKDRWQRSGESGDTYLQGRITGLNAIRRSGTPGIGADLHLRGFNSLYTNNQPLIIVDGIIYDNTDFGISLIAGHVDNPIANIDLKDIDGISVIKDATASSYGTRGGNGVVLITTNKSTEQATQIDFSAFGGINSTPSNLPVMGANDYRSYLSDALYSSLREGGYTELQSQGLVSNAPYINSENSSYYNYNNNTNWQDKVFNTSYNQSYYLRVSGGDNIATYGLSVGYLNNSGITRNTDMQRYQTRFNANLNMSTKLKANANLSFVSNSHNIQDQGRAPKTNPIYLALTKSPFLSSNITTADGLSSPNLTDVDVFQRGNPVSLIDNMQGRNKNYRFMGSVGFDYEFTKQLKLNVLAGITFSKVRENIFIPQKGVVADTLMQALAINRSGANVERLYSMFTDTRLSYNKNFNYVHNLSTNVGFRYNSNKMETDYGLGYNSATDDYVSVGQGNAALRYISGNNGNWRWLNMYANADYSYLTKYFLTFNLGVDGSSRFGKDATQGINLGGNKFAIMPSIAAAWLVSSERFMANSNFADVLKIRASYGRVGNEDIGNYSAKQYYVSQNFFDTQGLVRGNVPNTELQWENVTKLTGGIDVSFLKERLNLNFDVFSNKTTDMLVLEPVSTVTGFESGFTNNGAMTSKGVELGIIGRILNKSVKWDMGLNISNYKTEITKIPGDRLINEYAGATILTQKGMAANLFYGYKTNGVYSTTADVTAANVQNRRADGTITQFQAGDIRFVDKNGDHFIDENDRQVIGDPNPEYTGMWSNMVSYKRFSFDAIFTFSSGNDLYNSTRRDLESMSGSQNQTAGIVNRWKTEGQVTNVPRAIIGDPNENARFSDRWIEDGSYIRLRTLSVAYNVPIRNMGIKSARVYLTGNNVFTLSKYLGYDPEFSASRSIFSQGVDTGLEPQFRTVQLGVRIGL